MEQIISADAARAYLHISKRKFLYMLQNGYIRYEDNGNKTHRYSLRMCDVEALRKEMTNHPERFADLTGRIKVLFDYTGIVYKQIRLKYIRV